MSSEVETPSTAEPPELMIEAGRTEAHYWNNRELPANGLWNFRKTERQFADVI
jgi:hypothetical protein